jgi:hypothetical protein
MNSRVLVVAVLATAFIGFNSIVAFARGGSYSGGSYSGSGSSHSVHGYTRKDGTYVAPHRQTDPDDSRRNNWSSKGNTNPYTGKEGTVDPDQPRNR